MTRKGLVAMLAVLLLTVAVGCKKKQPKTSDDLSIRPTTVEPSPQEVTSGPEPTIGGDRTPDPLSGDLQEATEHARRAGLLGDVFFALDRYELEAEARDRLAQNARFLTEHPEFIVTIEGHADERGTNEYNLALGDRRASAAKDYLVSLGVSSQRVRTVSYGEERPFCGQSNESCWAQNRRAHFAITGRADVG
ncbi:MAG TPA: peptidoglycan-associated lipoprotein Pal [Thermoanaerobaculia bacterium]|nr:peptidoglycan-associated lipoprotein Pal [Thermoanaerobaculia bacterium]